MCSADDSVSRTKVYSADESLCFVDESMWSADERMFRRREFIFLQTRVCFPQTRDCVSQTRACDPQTRMKIYYTNLPCTSTGSWTSASSSVPCSSENINKYIFVTRLCNSSHVKIITTNNFNKFRYNSVLENDGNEENAKHFIIWRWSYSCLDDTTLFNHLANRMLNN